MSLGKADAAIVAAKSGALADALATALANRIQQSDDLESAVKWAAEKEHVIGALAICGDALAVQGDLKMVGI